MSSPDVTREYGENSLPEDITDHVETLVEFANKHFTEDKQVDIAATRVEEWLGTYRPE